MPLLLHRGARPDSLHLKLYSLINIMNFAVVHSGRGLNHVRDCKKNIFLFSDIYSTDFFCIEELAFIK